MLVTKFSINKSKRCTTAWLNLRTILSMQFLHTKSCLRTVVWPTRRTAMRVHWKDVPLHNFLTYMDVFAWKCPYRSTCLHTTCHTISYVVLDRHVSTQCVSTTRRIHAHVHTLKGGCLYTFWLTKSCLCVTLNISHHVCHIISHRCSRNKVQHHNFLTYEPFSLCNFDLQGHLRAQNCHIGGRVCVLLTT